LKHLIPNFQLLSKKTKEKCGLLGVGFWWDNVVRSRGGVLEVKINLKGDLSRGGSFNLLCTWLADLKQCSNTDALDRK
jgi:hypothetical protein